MASPTVFQETDVAICFARQVEVRGRQVIAAEQRRLTGQRAATAW